MAVILKFALGLMLATAEPGGKGVAETPDALLMLQQSAWMCAEAGETLEASEVFECLAKRYRQLDSYSDVTEAVCESTGSEAGAESDFNRIELRLDCSIRDGKLKVFVPLSQMRRLAGMTWPVDLPPPLERLRRRYELWLAPHMLMHESDEPLRAMLRGVTAGQSELHAAMEVQSVMLDEKPMVRLQLKSAGAEGAKSLPEGVGGSDSVAGSHATRSNGGGGEHAGSFIDLFVNPHSMLIERVETRRTMPDGRTWSTRLEIAPREGEPTSADVNAGNATGGEPGQSQAQPTPAVVPLKAAPDRGPAVSMGAD